MPLTGCLLREFLLFPPPFLSVSPSRPAAMSRAHVLPPRQSARSAPRWPWLAALLLSMACGGQDGPPTAPEITLTVPSTSLEIGGNVQLSALGARGPVTWSSSNTAVATVVSTGFVTAVGPGTTTITVSTPTQSANTVLTVTAPPAIGLATNSVAFTARVGGTDPAPRTVAITNTAPGSLQGLTLDAIEYTAGEPTGWLSAALSATTASSAQPAQLQLTAAVNGLAAGSYSARLSVSAAQSANGPQELTVTLVVSPAPTLVVPTTDVALSVTGGSSTAVERTFDITAGLVTDTLTGLTATVSTASGAPSGWLTASLDRTSTPAVLRLAALAGALAPGSYTAEVALAAPAAGNSPQSITVTLEVTPPPALQLTATTAAFVAVVGGANPAPAAIGITNAGGGTLTLGSIEVSYPAGAPSGWLSAVRSSPTAPSTLTLQPTTGALSAGTYTATVRVNAPGAVGAPATVAVTFVVGDVPRIALSASTAAFEAGVGGADPEAEEISVTNSGSGALEELDVSVSYGAGGSDWLDASLNTTTAPATLTLQPHTNGLTAGTYTATVSVAAPLADNSPRTVTVSFTLSATPTIGVSRTAVAITAPVGALAPTELVNISNSGGGELTGLTTSIEYGAGSNWLSASLSGASAPATLSLEASALALAAGTYTATVRVASPTAINSPRTIAVTLTVVAQPAIGLSVTSRTFTAASGGVNPAAQTVSVTNAGTGALTGLSANIVYASGSGWLSATLNTTTAPATLTLQPTTAGLAVGTYSATVNVVSPVAFNSPRTVTVTFTVTTPPAIGLNATSRSFSANAGGANPASQTVSITNTGGGSLTGLARTISYSSGSGWLTATLNTTTAPATLTLQPATAGLGGGTYSATVTITSPVATNSPRTVTVTFTVAPTIVLSATSRSFTAPNGGGNPSSQTVAISSQNGGVMTGISRTVSYSSGSGWLSTTLNTTTAPATLTIQPLTGSLAAGTYSATINISATGASNAPRSVTVTFTVPSAAIGLSTTSVSLTRTSGTGTTSTSVTVTNAGAGTLSLSPSPPSVTYTGGPSTGWLTASYSTTSVTTGSSTLTLTVNAGTAGAPRTPGTYTATVTVASPVAANRTISVTFTVPVSLANNIWASLNPYCSACHFSGGSPPALTSAAGFRSAMVNVATVRRAGYSLATTYPTRITPGNASTSYLTYQLAKSANAYHMPTSTASTVPVSLRSLISTWINQGANNN